MPPDPQDTRPAAPPRPHEELANSLSHGIGYTASVAGLTLMVVFAAQRHQPLQIVACSIYGGTLVLLYLASTLYHAATHPPPKRRLRVFDHASIYLLIAGTYTPLTLLVLEPRLAWTLFGLVWAMAGTGLVFKVRHTGKWKVLSTGLYLAMGWMAVLLIRPLLAQLPVGAVVWLGVGGLFYTLGAGVYACRRIPYHHALWHLFVLGGSACHFFVVLHYIVLRPGA